MLLALRRSGLLGSAIAVIIAFAILVGLGTWQMQRKTWKERLLAQIAERTHAEPVPLADVLSRRGDDPEYFHVSVSGRFHHDKEQFLWAPHPTQGLGYQVFTPLETTPGRVVWVNRGYVTHERKEPAARAEGQIAGDVTVTGLVRKPVAEAGAFTPDNEAYRHMFYWRDLQGMQQAAFGNAGPQPLPVFVDADAAPANPGGWPQGGVTLINLPNRHLEYAITWYGLAGTLLAVYAAFVAARFRRASAGPGQPDIR